MYSTYVKHNIITFNPIVSPFETILWSIDLKELYLSLGQHKFYRRIEYLDIQSSFQCDGVEFGYLDWNYYSRLFIRSIKVISPLVEELGLMWRESNVVNNKNQAPPTPMKCDGFRMKGSLMPLTSD